MSAPGHALQARVGHQDAVAIRGRQQKSFLAGFEFQPAGFTVQVVADGDCFARCTRPRLMHFESCGVCTLLAVIRERLRLDQNPAGLFKLFGDDVRHKRFRAVYAVAGVGEVGGSCEGEEESNKRETREVHVFHALASTSATFNSRPGGVIVMMPAE